MSTVKAVALAEIVYRKDGVRTIAAPNSVFECPEAEYAGLLRKKAVRAPEPVDLALFSMTNPAPVAAVEEKPKRVRKSRAKKEVAPAPEPLL